MFEWVIERFVGLIGPIATMAKDKRELQDNALRAISHALFETKLYYRNIGTGRGRDLDTEVQLARYWSAAAIPLRHIDEELAMTCENKADYWLNPEHWSNDDIQKLGIRLEEVSGAYKKLVAPKHSPKYRVFDA